MAATAKHDLRQNFPTDSTGEEDIAAIAKQISDHAEAIYQTWKSRGLAPTEILNCHSNATAADKFDSVLTPKNSPTAAELLAQAPNLDNNKLEKLVNNFVVEDKARLAASRQKSPSKTLPSSIQFALEKFERGGPAQPSSSSAKTSPGKPQVQPKGPAANLANFANKPCEITRPQASPNAKSAPSRHSEIFLETIEASFPADLTPSRIVVQERRPTSVLTSRSRVERDGVGPNFNGSSTPSGLTTWPLKNKISNGETKRTANSNSQKNQRSIENGDRTESETATTSPPSIKETSRSPDTKTATGLKSELADEVAREEERLINALMTGVVIPEETPERAPESPAARQKPAIKKEKPKVDPVKPIILAHGSPSGIAVPISNVTPVQQNSSTTDQPRLFTKDDLTAMSVVDYAKVRYRAAQQNPLTQKRLEEQRIQPTIPGQTSDHSQNHNHNHHHHHHHHHHHNHHRRINNVATTNNNDENTRNNNSNVVAGGVEDGGGNQERIVSTVRTKFEPGLATDKVKEDSKESSGPSRWGPRINTGPCRPRLEQLVPHPELTTQQRQHIRAAAATGTGSNPVRPFLTRGSVAERVLIFEKCPSELLLDKRGPRQPAIVTWRTGDEVQSKAQNYAREKIQPQKNLPPHTTLQRHVRANRNNVLIPRFYFPGGKPIPASQLDATLSRITTAFQSLPGHRATKTQFHIIAKACDCPLYWKVPLFLASGGERNGYVDQHGFIEFWKGWSNLHHDAASKFVGITTRGIRDFIIPEDLIPLVQDVVETHPGLTFLKEATEFHSRYVHTVVARIFYSVNRSWSGKITVSELRRSNLLAVISVLEHEEDINQVTAYFSYEHFYVIYCKFWELDRDHDLLIDKLDLTRHNDNALSTRMIERIFSGAVTRGGVKTSGSRQQDQNNINRIEIDETDVDIEINDDRQRHRNHNHQYNHQSTEDNKMSYTEFVWFLLSEEDKNHPTAIEYWFRCMDLDGDGYLSMYELEYFYEEQLHRMEAIGIETLPFEDCLCQMLDMIRPTIPGKISLSDLKRCKMTSIFFDTFFNLEKYLDHEQRDPFASARDHDADGHELSDWDRFAAEEYELLVAEESGNEQNEQMLCDDEM